MTVSGGRMIVPSLPGVPVPRSCGIDAAFFTLNWVLTWTADVEVAGQRFTQVGVAELLRRVSADPAAFGVETAEAQVALSEFTAQARAAVEAFGGQRDWVERELWPAGG